MAGCDHTPSEHERRLLEAMLPKTPEDCFWRSPEGNAQYSDLLDAHYARLLETVQHAGSIREFPHPTCDVLVLEDVGGEGAYMAITKGLSGFILGPPCHAKARICHRQEFAWAFAHESEIDGVVKFLRDLADHVLSGRHWFMVGDAIRGVDFTEYLGKPCTPTAMGVTQGMFVTEEAQGVIANHFEGLVMELFPFTASEADWFERDPEGFCEACEAQEVDFHDMQRASM